MGTGGRDERSKRFHPRLRLALLGTGLLVAAGLAGATEPARALDPTIINRLMGGSDWYHALDVIASVNETSPDVPVVLLLGGSCAREAARSAQQQDDGDVGGCLVDRRDYVQGVVPVGAAHEPVDGGVKRAGRLGRPRQPGRNEKADPEQRETEVESLRTLVSSSGSHAGRSLSAAARGRRRALAARSVWLWAQAPARCCKRAPTRRPRRYSGMEDARWSSVEGSGGQRPSLSGREVCGSGTCLSA